MTLSNQSHFSMVKLVVFLCLLVLVALTQARYHRRVKCKGSWYNYPSGRIVGGVDTDITQVPNQVQLFTSIGMFCGGSILSATHVLTAAHCTDGLEAKDIIILYGTSQFAAGGTTVQVAKIAQHPRFDFNIIDFDVSVLRLKNKITFSDKAQPIGLASVEPNAGEEGIVSGWGLKSRDGEQPSMQLQSVVIPVISREECNGYGNVHVAETMFCGGVPGKGTCLGDSGGPFIINNVQSGIVSWSYDCAGRNYPSGFTNIAAYRDFIDKNSDYTARWL